MLHGFPRLQQFSLTLDLISHGAFQGAETVQVLDLDTRAEWGRLFTRSCNRPQRNVRLDAQHAFLHVAGVDAQVAQDSAQRLGVGADFLAGMEIRLGDDLQQGYAGPVQIHQCVGATFMVALGGD